MAAATAVVSSKKKKKRSFAQARSEEAHVDDDASGGGVETRVVVVAQWRPEKLYDNLALPYCRDVDTLLFPMTRRLYVYGRQLEPWWFQARANVREPEREVARRLTGNSVAAACGLDEYKSSADLGRELCHDVNASVPMANERTQRSLDYGHLHQDRAHLLLSRLVFDDRVPLYEIGFVVDDQDEFLGTSPDYLLMPFDSPLSTLKSDGRGVVVEVKCSARSLLEHPHVSHICQMHQEMALCGWTTFGLLVAYWQNAVRVWRVDFNLKLWSWMRLRSALFMHVMSLLGHTGTVHSVLSQCRLLRNVAHDTKEWWFPPSPANGGRRAMTPAQLGVGRTHVASSLSREEQRFLDMMCDGWRESFDFCRQYLCILPPDRPTVTLVYEHVTPTPSTLLSAVNDADTRDEYGLVKRELWLHDQPIDWSLFTKHPNASHVQATGSKETLERRHRLLVHVE